MLFEDAVHRTWAAQLNAHAAFYVNTVRELWVTCSICSTPLDPQRTYDRCYRCNMDRTAHGDSLADVVASLVYAIDGRTSGQVMSGYKRAVHGQLQPQPEHKATVSLLLNLSQELHRDCAGRLLRAPVTHRAVVPSTRRPDRSPLAGLLILDPAVTDHPLTPANLNPHAVRQIDAGMFAAPPLPPGSHVQVLDDTWTTRAHAQSAAMALRAAGAAHVSILTVARWLQPSYRDTAAFMRDRHAALRPYDPAVCPWTGGLCPG